MNINIKTHLAAAALCLTALLATGCTQDDLAGQPAGSIPLSIGSVSIAGTETAGTRAVVTEDAKGYTGIRKTCFVDGDELQLNVSDAAGASLGTPKATLTGGKWVLDAPVYVTPGSTRISIRHQGATQVQDILTDDLGTDAYTLNGQQISFSLTHKNAMIDVTVPAGITLTSVSLRSYDADGNPKTYVTTPEEAADGTHYRAILAPSLKVDGVTAVVGGQSYLATFATPITAEANKRYPVTLTFKENKLTATIGTATLDWGTGGSGELEPAGYTIFLRTPEDLAQFAKDANDDVAGTGASKANVLQLADIDLSQLKTAAEANAAYPGKNYTYTATAYDWVAINKFNGTFNGNGFIINHMEGRTVAMFDQIAGAKLTGIHLRNIDWIGPSGAATLVNHASNSTVTLCSVTGNRSDSFVSFVYQSENSFFTRCSTDVENPPCYGGAGGFISISSGDVIVGCTVSGSLDFSEAKTAPTAGFIGSSTGSTLFGCSFTGTITTGANSYAFVGSGDAATTISSCYATHSGENNGFGLGGDTYYAYKACAYMGTQSLPLPGVTGDVAAANLYKTLTLGNASTAAPVKTLHWSAAGGYMLTEVSKLWGAPGIWKDNGASAPTINMAYEGGLDFPAPITGGNSVYEVNGYWVTAPEADEMKEYMWNTDVNATAMEPDLCANHGNWRMPTMKDFEVMAGWSTTNPWTGNTDGTACEITDKTLWETVFSRSGNGYWSSVSNTGINYNFVFTIVYASGSWQYGQATKANTLQVRCVQKK